MSLYRSVDWSVGRAGEWSDCDQCGGQAEELNVSWDGYTFNAYFTIGCYGGDSIYDAGLCELLEWLGQLPTDYLSASDERELMVEVRREWEANNPQ